ncbi:outer membrane beta-barrel protein [bacterium]|nr:outer membrane beta-barrel protein [bacterium]
MKKILCLFFVLFSMSIFAESENLMKLSVTAGLSYGIGDGYEYTDLKTGFNVGGVFHYNLEATQPNLSAEGILNYTYYKGESTSTYEYSYGMLEILGGAKYSISEQLGFIGGLGFYKFIFEFDDKTGDLYNDYDSSASYLGLFVGAIFNIDDRISIRGLLHLPDFDPDVAYIRINFAYSFPL